ncbi:MAG: hypothetical protein ABI386_01525 [Rhodanobacter sp.]
MSIFKQIARVRVARSRMQAARYQLHQPAHALLSRGREYPLTMVGAASGAGFVFGCLNVQPLRVPGMAAALSGGAAQVVAQGTRLLAELAALGVGASFGGGHPSTPDVPDVDPA